MPRLLRDLRIDAFYQNIFKDVDVALRRRRNLYGDPLADLRRYGKVGLRPIRKDDDDRRVSVDDLTDDDVASINDEIDQRNGGSGSSESRHIDYLADLLAEAQGIPRQQALTWLWTADGQALIRRTRAKRLEEGEETMKWEDIAKVDGGGDAIVDVVLNTVAKGDTPSLDQQTLTKHLTTAAKRLHPNLRPDVAFAKAFEANESWRRAMLSVRGF